jgi:WD40 repeat protein
MELVKGVPITRFCDERQLSTRERLELFIPVCQAIQHAHQKGVIHRDIKPTNVLVALYDDRPVPKVIDFGVAKAAGSQLTDASLVTGFGAIVGTPEYMSPEQAQLNQLDIDTRSDVYALGVLLYELLTGTTPIDGKRLGHGALLEILRVIREEEPPRPSTRLSTSEALASIAATRKTEPAKLTKLMRGELDWIVMKCLEKERSRRYETANALARDLERYLHDELVEAQPPSAGYRLRKFARKHRTGLAMAASIMLLLLGGAAVSTWQAVRARQAEMMTAQALTVAEENQREAEQQRKKAETQAASLAVDIDLKYCKDGEVALGMLRLADSLKTIPEHAKELRECVALNILAWGQTFRPAVGALDHDGYDVTQAIFSPDGKMVLSLGRDGTTRLSDSLTGKLLRTCRQPLQGLRSAQTADGLFQFSGDGSTALTLLGNRIGTAPLDGVSLVRYDSDNVVRLWDVATGQLRVATPKLPGNVYQVALSENGSLLVTACTLSWGYPWAGRSVVFFWNGRTGQLIRKFDFDGHIPGTDVSPDGKTVLVSCNGHFEVWSPEGGQPQKRLPGNGAAFSASGKSAISRSEEVVHWWDTADWHLHRDIPIPKELQRNFDSAHVLGDEVVVMEFLVQSVEATVEKRLVATKNVRASIVEDAGNATKVSLNDRLLAVGSHVYSATTGGRLSLPRGRKFQPELKQFADDGRFVAGSDSYLVDLTADKRIDFKSDGRFLKSHETWLALDSDHRILLLRKADALLGAELLQKWCQVVARGKLDENGRFSKFDEANWEKARMELAQLLDSTANAQSLRAAVTDRLYWLRQEIKAVEEKDAPAAISLLDRLIAAEPLWPNYSKRAGVHTMLQQFDLAMRDELAAARLAGERYWFAGSSNADWWLGAQLVKATGRPAEQYELVLRWVDAQVRAGVAVASEIDASQYQPRPGVIAGVALFRLGRYADALAKLHTNDIPMISECVGMLMSPWNDKIVVTINTPKHVYLGSRVVEYFDPVDLLERAMCHHHLGHPTEAKACLDQARGILSHQGPDINGEQRGFLREAESLIMGKPRP